MDTQNLFEVLERIYPLSSAFKEALKEELQTELFPKNHFLVQIRSVAHHSWFLEIGFAVAYYFSERKRIHVYDLHCCYSEAGQFHSLLLWWGPGEAWLDEAFDL